MVGDIHTGQGPGKIQVKSGLELSCIWGLGDWEAVSRYRTECCRPRRVGFRFWQSGGRVIDIDPLQWVWSMM